MSDIVFILGAGASKECGAPLMNDFLETAMKLLSLNDVCGHEQDFKRVFQTISKLQAVHSKAKLDLHNIESIFTTLEIGQILGKLPGINSDDIQDVIDSLKKVIVITLERTIKFPVTRRESRGGQRLVGPHNYQHLSNLLHYVNTKASPNRSTSVITFNYDVALDVAMCRKGLGPVYGFGPEVKCEFPIKLLKLHGSLNWAVSDGLVHPFTFEKLFSHYYYFEPLIGNQDFGYLPIGSELKNLFSEHLQLEVEPEPVIIPPAWNKADYHRILPTIWGEAAKELEEAEHVFIIGYSLPETDAFFKLLYGLGTAGEKILQRVVVYNPDDSGVVENRFREMMGQGSLDKFSYRPLTFNEAVTEIPRILAS